MQIDFKRVLAAGGIVVMVGLGAACGRAWTSWQIGKQVTALQNAAAKLEQTIELKEGLYAKSVVELEDALGALDAKDKQVKDLLAQVKKGKEAVVSSTALVLRWKKALTGAATARQTRVPRAATAERLVAAACEGRARVDFKKDFSSVIVEGYTLTDPAEAYVTLTGRPLKLNLALTQRPDRSWRTYATSSDSNTQVEIGSVAVNPLVFQPKWYERLGVVAGVGAGPGVPVSATGLLGLTYDLIEGTSIGPFVSLGYGGGTFVQTYGVLFTSRPFKKRR